MSGGLWRELELTEGSHVIEMSYDPPGLHEGIQAAVGAMVVLLLSLLAAGYRDRLILGEIREPS